MAHILKSRFLCSQGEKSQTLKAIETLNIKVEESSIRVFEGEEQLPYYRLQNFVEDESLAIYEALRGEFQKIISSLSKTQREGCALLIGTSIIDWNIADAIEATDKKERYNSEKLSIDTYAQRLSKEFGLSGYTQSINTACTSSANALLEAKNLLDASLYAYVVVMGIEIFSKVMSSGFHAMQLLSRTECKPFSKERDGMVLGEGIGAILLAKEPSPWKLLGGYTNANAKNITGASEEGEEFCEVMQEAMERVGVKSQEVNAIKAHATGTLSNDLAELNAIKRLFSQELIFTGLKPYIGHTVGACGVIEMALFMVCVDAGFLPQTPNVQTPMDTLYKPLSQNRVCKSGTFMMNYFGFGGNNCSILIQKGEE